MARIGTVRTAYGVRTTEGGASGRRGVHGPSEISDLDIALEIRDRERERE